MVICDQKCWQTHFAQHPYLALMGFWEFFWNTLILGLEISQTSAAFSIIQFEGVGAFKKQLQFENYQQFSCLNSYFL